MLVIESKVVFHDCPVIIGQIFNEGSTIPIETVIINLINLTLKEALRWVLRIQYNLQRIVLSRLVKVVKSFKGIELVIGQIEAFKIQALLSELC